MVSPKVKVPALQLGKAGGGLMSSLSLDGLPEERERQALTVEGRSPRIGGLSLELGSSPRGPHMIEDSWKGEILAGFLYLGDRMTAGESDRLNLLGITHVLNMTHDVANFYEGKDVGSSERRLSYMRCALKDRIDADIGQHFPGACDFISRARETGGRVLVHCRAGMSRSATIVVGYLMVTKKWNLKRALHHVDSCRFVQPNSGFMAFLIGLERDLLGCTSLSPQDLDPGLSAGGNDGGNVNDRPGGFADRSDKRPPPTGA